MRNQHLRLAMVCAALALMAVTAPSWARSESGTFDRTLSVSGSASVDVMTPYGEITVTSGAPGSVTVSARIKANSGRGGDYTPEEIVSKLTENPPIEQAGNTIRIGHISEMEKKRGLYSDVQIYYEITVPADTAVKAKSGYGDIGVYGVELPAEVKTGYGNVVLSKPTGSVSVKTGYGDIKVEGAPTADWELITGYGHVKLQLPADAAFELDARTGYGDINTDHPITLSGGISHSRLRGTVRDGGPEVVITTGFGDIILD